MTGFLISFWIAIAESFDGDRVRRTGILLGGLAVVLLSLGVATQTIHGTEDPAFGKEQWFFIPVSLMLWFLTGVLTRWHVSSLVVAGVLLAAAFYPLTIWMIGPTAGAIAVVGLWFWFLSRVWASVGLPP